MYHGGGRGTKSDANSDLRIRKDVNVFFFPCPRISLAEKLVRVYKSGVFHMRSLTIPKHCVLRLIFKSHPLSKAFCWTILSSFHQAVTRPNRENKEIQMTRQGRATAMPQRSKTFCSTPLQSHSSFGLDFFTSASFYFFTNFFNLQQGGGPQYPKLASKSRWGPGLEDRRLCLHGIQQRWQQTSGDESISPHRERSRTPGIIFNSRTISRSIPSMPIPRPHPGNDLCSSVPKTGTRSSEPVPG